jgi:hypothetical protein
MGSRFSWDQVIEVVAEACSPSERRVLLVLGDRSYHVREVLAPPGPGQGELFGFVVYTDDPTVSPTSDDASLIFVRPGEIVRVQVTGEDGHGKALGF